MSIAIHNLNEIAQSVIDQAAIVASLNSATVQPQTPPTPAAYVRKFGDYLIVGSSGLNVGYYSIVAPPMYLGVTIEPMLYPYQFDQQTNLAILKYQNVQSRAKETESEFNKLVAEWRNDKKATSSSTALAMHPAYQSIIGMGEKALPFIFADLQHGLDHWFWALRAITHENPVSPEIRGNMQAMANTWLNWGREKGYVPR